VHRIRDRLVARRTAVINQIRAFLLEQGMVFAQKPAKLKPPMADVLVLENADNALTPMMRNLISMLRDEWKTVEQQIEELTDRLEQIAASDAGCCRIRQVLGNSPLRSRHAQGRAGRTKPCEHHDDRQCVREGEGGRRECHSDGELSCLDCAGRLDHQRWKAWV
jgi:transposase